MIRLLLKTATLGALLAFTTPASSAAPALAPVSRTVKVPRVALPGDELQTSGKRKVMRAIRDAPRRSTQVSPHPFEKQAARQEARA